MSPPSSLRRAGSRAFVVAGVVSVPVGLLTMVYPPALDETLWGHPFDRGTAVVVSIVLVVAHLLKVPGFVALSPEWYLNRAATAAILGWMERLDLGPVSTLPTRTRVGLCSSRLSYMMTEPLCAPSRKWAAWFEFTDAIAQTVLAAANLTQAAHQGGRHERRS
jgi:hypothetical protein